MRKYSNAIQACITFVDRDIMLPALTGVILLGLKFLGLVLRISTVCFVINPSFFRGEVQ